MSSSEQSLHISGGGRDFASTHWSVVLLAGSAHSPQAAEALEKLAAAYWYPLYSFVRRQGYGPHKAADLTQDFFVHLLATDALVRASPSRGNFRSFLLASLKNLLANEWHRERCQKRGGGRELLSLDVELAEGRFQLEAADSLPPDRAFDRRWAEVILARALDRLRVECDEQQKVHRFDALKTFLLGEKGAQSLEETAVLLNLSVPAVKGLVHRLRRRFRELIRDEIAQTVARREEVEREIQDLFAVLRD